MTTVDDLIAEIERSYAELTEQLADPEVLGDRVRYAEAARAHAELQPVHELTRGYREAQLTVTDAEALLADGSTDAEMRAFAQEELADGRRRLGELADEIRARVLTRDPNDGKDVIIEIRAGAGGAAAGTAGTGVGAATGRSSSGVTRMTKDRGAASIRAMRSASASTTAMNSFMTCNVRAAAPVPMVMVPMSKASWR